MPDEDVTVSIAGVAKVSYTITVNPMENGTVAADTGATATYEQAVTLTATPAGGYEFHDIAIKHGETEVYIDSEKEIGDTGVWEIKFTMPAANVTVSAEFIQGDISVR